MKENILFGRPFHEERFLHVIFACALATDVSQFRNGLDEEIGENGGVDARKIHIELVGHAM